ncbi:hypothetical protein GCM10009830_46650 [Glycomyces endophyticus]|uniref:Helix-hairpin-helix domain-containing protein n=1 Tax=Glycomyces endophyticus TaxID=480996 RepID=A0ABP4TTI9_9ACTN
MTAPGPYVPPIDEQKRLIAHRVGRTGTYLWALSPLFTCGYAAPVMLAIALARRRDNLVLAALVVHSALLSASCLVMGTFADKTPLWGDVLIYTSWFLAAIGGTAHLLVIRPAVFPVGAPPQVPVAQLSNAEVLDRARKLRDQARRTAEADPMLAKRLAIGRPDLPRQFDDGGLVDVNHAPLHLLTSLPGVTERSARQIQEWVERSGPFASLGEVMLVIEISPTFEHHLREYCVFIP